MSVQGIQEGYLFSQKWYTYMVLDLGTELNHREANKYGVTPLHELDHNENQNIKNTHIPHTILPIFSFAIMIFSKRKLWERERGKYPV